MDRGIDEKHSENLYKSGLFTLPDVFKSMVYVFVDGHTSNYDRDYLIILDCIYINIKREGFYVVCLQFIRLGKCQPFQDSNYCSASHTVYATPLKTVKASKSFLHNSFNDLLIIHQYILPRTSCVISNWLTSILLFDL